MWSVLAIILILIIFIIFCAIFFIAAVSDEKVSLKSAEELYISLPKSITEKWIVRYNIGRPQGKFLKMKNFQGCGVLYVEDNKIKFEDILGNETHDFDLNASKISWVENKINGITNAFKIVDADRAMFFYVDKGMSIIKTININEATAQLYARLKTIRKNYKKIKKAESEGEL